MMRNAVAALPNKRLLRVEGADVIKFLQGIFTNDMHSFDVRGDARYGGFLTHKGRLLGDADVVQTDINTFFIGCDEEVANDMLKHLKKYKLRSKVKFDAVDDDFRLHAILPALQSTPKQYKNLIQWKDLINKENTANKLVYEDPRGQVFGLKAIVSSSESVPLPKEFVQENETSSLYKDRRILLGACEGLEHLDGIPLEHNLELLNGVSFTKGCYVGQELTARTHYKGNIRKRLLPVLFLPTSVPFSFSFTHFDNSWMDHVTTSIPAGVEVGTSITTSDTDSRAGKVITLASGVNAAVAMMRLEQLTKAPGLKTADGSHHVLPYIPSWWPPLDATTGKPIEN
ncbi:hypothetical protein THRCLA_01293 [Thraustotheca clavata]|uniref:CAF17 C-terminal domain-containing protein n=1 Tax=Thraustotheca clavata TaxID=74557 RepID=A0A1W0A9I5_9STRA|nr:hypothetical protein THRCLA_01293 [Thraustotheca clavata]